MGFDSAASSSCSFCGSTTSHVIGLRDRHGYELRTVICTECGLVRVDPRRTAEQLEFYYRETYRREYKGAVQPKKKHVFRAGLTALRRLEDARIPIRAGMRVLDVGCGGGEVLYLLRTLGCQVRGVEPNRGYAEYARSELGLPVEDGRLQDRDFELESFDLITLFHVLEHLDDAVEALRKLRPWLHPDGLLLIEVPNIEATCSHPASRFHVAHLTHFNTATLVRAGEAAGFRAVSSWASGDKGNISAIFVREDDPKDVVRKLEGNCERILRIHRRHTAWRYYLRAGTCIRLLRRISRTIWEQLAISRYTSRREILDSLSPRLTRGDTWLQ